MDVDRAGGIPVIAKRLLEGGFIDGGQMTVTGRTLAEEANAAVETPGQDVIVPSTNRSRPPAASSSSRGQPRPGGLRRQGRRPRAAPKPIVGRRVFEREEDAMAAVTGRQSGRATWWLFATRGRAAGRACARCWG
ncbi:MAG: dihydroxy-acid dehydratase [Dehalococcoidia bacterium]